MKKIILPFILSIFCFSFSQAQCNFKGISNKFQKYSASDSKPKLDLATKPKLLFDKFYFVGMASFAKSGEDSFLYLYLVRNLSKKMEIKSDQPLTIQTAKGNKIELFPTGNYTGKRYMTTYAIGCFYQLSKEQLEILANEDLDNIVVSITSEIGKQSSDDTTGEGWHKGENGNVYFKKTIYSVKNKDRFRNAANCLLSKT